MPIAKYDQPPEGFLTMTQAQERVGVSKRTLQKMVADRGLQLFADPRDGRVRLVRVEDIDALTRPVPIAAKRAA